MDNTSDTARDRALVFLNSEQPKQTGRLELAVALQGAFEKLRIHLTRRLGSEGYRALLSRALALSSRQSSWIASLTVETDGALLGFEQSTAQESLSSVLDGSVELVASLIGLLDTFVGKELSLRLLSDIWPESAPQSEVAAKEDLNDRY